MADPLRVTKRLIQLRQGEELLLLNALWPRPMYVPSGAGYVLEFVERLRGQPRESVKAFERESERLGAPTLSPSHALTSPRPMSPEDRHLFQALVAHRLVLPAEQDEPPTVSAEALGAEQREELSVFLRLSENGQVMSEKTLEEALSLVSRRLAQEGALRLTVQAAGQSALIRRGAEILDDLRPDAQWTCEAHGVCLNALEGLPPAERLTLWVEWREGVPMAELERAAETRPVVALVQVHRGNVERLVDIAQKLAAVAGLAGLALEPIRPGDAATSDRLPDPALFTAQLAAIYRMRLFKPENLYPVNRWLAKLERGRGYPWECGMPLGNTLCIGPNGDMYPCPETCAPEFRLGNVHRHVATNCHPTPDTCHPAQRWAVEWTVERVSECAGCQWRYLCGGGCPGRRMKARAEREAEQAYRLLCEPRRRGFEMLLWDLARQKRAEVKRERVTQCASEPVCQPTR